MHKKNIFFDISNELNPKYNILNFVLSIILVCVGISFFMREGYFLTAIMDLTFAIIGFIIHINRNKLPLQTKLMFTLVLLHIFAIYSLYNGGFLGNGILALAIIIIVAVSYLDYVKSTVVSILVFFTLVGFTASIYLGIFDLNSLPIERYYDPIDWVYQTIAMAVLIFTAFFSVNTIRKLLIKSILSLKSIAYQDSLTGLNNRNYFLNVLPEELKNHDNQPVMIAILDLLNFRLVNSLQGVAQGDLFLQTIGDIMSSYATDEVRIARIGSNEFALLAIGWTQDDFNTYAINCFNALQNSEKPINALPTQKYVAAYKAFYYSKSEFESAFRHVSLTVKYAKEKGLTGRVPFTKEILDVYEEEAYLLDQIPNALASHAFSVHFQGKWNVSEQHFTGYEALARWTLHDGRMISPSVFIPLINKSTYMMAFSKHLIQIAIKDFETIQVASKYKLSLSLNVSPLFFLSEGFVDFILNAVSNSTLQNDQILIEITEDVFINDYQVINDRVIALNNAQIRISLDDFGTGYSSLSHLNSLDIQEIKMDRSLVAAISESDKPKILMETIANMAKRMNCVLVAEGVENEAQFERVNSLGCNIIQGYYFSKPMSKDDLLAKNNLDAL